MSSAIEWGVASRALPGQPTSGDLNVVKSFPDGVLVAALQSPLAARLLASRHSPTLMDLKSYLMDGTELRQVRVDR